MESYKYERIDGSITGQARQDAIDRFNGRGKALKKHRQTMKLIVDFSAWRTAIRLPAVDSCGRSGH